MKHPKDEDIEKYALEFCSKYISTYDVHDVINYKLGIIDGAKWARDQQPKLKTLEEWGWFRTSEGQYKVHVAVDYFDIWYFVYEEDDQWYYATAGEKWTRDGKGIWAESKEQAMQLAQTDYERRINELYI